MESSKPALRVGGARTAISPLNPSAVGSSAAAARYLPADQGAQASAARLASSALGGLVSLAEKGLRCLYDQCMCDIIQSTSRHEQTYLESLKNQERAASILCCGVGLAFSFDENFGSKAGARAFSGDLAQITLGWGILVLIVGVAAARVKWPSWMVCYVLHASFFVGGGLLLLSRAFSGVESYNTRGIIIRRLFIMQGLLALAFFCFRRHSKYALAFFVSGALALLPSLGLLPEEDARILYFPYLGSTFILTAIFAAFDVMNRKGHIVGAEYDLLQAIEIASLTQICHVIKNKLNYVESMLPDWGERFRRASGIEDPENEFGTMLFCVRASLNAVANVHVLRSIKGHTYATALEATQVDMWVREYANNHDVAIGDGLPSAVVHVDVRILGFVLEDAWSNAFKYGDTKEFKPEISARLVGPFLNVSITNRQLPGTGTRLPEDLETLFARGAKGAQATSISEGYGLADAREAAAAADGKVSLEENLRGDAWFTTFTVSLPAPCPQCTEIQIVAPAPTANAMSADETSVPLPGPFREGLTVLACDDEGVQRKVLERLILPKLHAAEASVVVGADEDEVLSAVPLALSLNADIVILDKNLLHRGILGTELADELRAAGFDGLIVLRTGSTGRSGKTDCASVDLIVQKCEKNMDVVERIKQGYSERRAMAG